MAANDYYTSASYPSRPYHDYDNNAPIPPPLPPLPSPYAQSTHSLPSRTYSGVSGDPFHDDNAIPLSESKKHDSSQSVSPVMPHEGDDPFVREADPSRSRRKKRRRRQAKQGWFTGKITWVVFVLTVVQLIVFLAEIIKNGVLTGSPIEIHPTFNPMIGPSPYVLINMGARYPPCMHNMDHIQNANMTITWPCPNATSTTGDSVSCSLSELCGFDGVPNPRPYGSLEDKPEPNQWWRFIVPIFIHAGIIHIGFNLLLQLTLGRDIELLIGSIRFAVVYFAAGIFGFVLGGNFAANGIASCGCSGSLFGILAITLLDLLYTWNDRPGPIKDLLFILLDCIVAFVLGLLPGLDNFSHIGGFLMGLVLGLCLLRSPAQISRRTISPTYSRDAPASRKERNEGGLKGFIASPLTFFQNRRPVWWVWWLVRVGTLVCALVCFILLLKNFYETYPTTCSWCKYLSCLPVTVNGVDWCQIGNLNFTPTNQTTSGNGNGTLGDPNNPILNNTSKRDVADLGVLVFDTVAAQLW